MHSGAASFMNVLLTYNDLARAWQVNPKTVSRWICRLEKQQRIKVLRPTPNTVRLTPEDAATLRQLRIRP